ncbi:phage minor capsid protein [Salinispora mooreana]|uniref:phage minor capsid protein n=1 Tax=Salinispora mooreana TaxID=999545 RepID=UPI00036B5326|nr:phage minor capsid protein [Salinispora mooreana]
MALSGEQIEATTRTLVDLYRDAEQAILTEVTRRLATGIDAADWQAQRLGALATVRSTVEQVLALVAADTSGHIRGMLASAYRSGQATATAGIPARLLPRDPDAGRAAGVIRAQGIRAGVMESLASALLDDVGQRHSNVLRHVMDVYRSVVQRATAVSVVGGMTRRQASQWAYQKFIDQGVTSFTDVRGRQWRLSSYVEMAARTVTQRAAVQGQTDRLTSLGIDLVIVSDSPRECERCRPWEGAILSISGAERGRVEMPSALDEGRIVTVDVAGTVEQARAAGLQHPNCTHSLRAYLPGATRRPAKPTANPDGYEAKDRQRAIERQIRRWKERETGALTPEAKTAARAKIRAWQKTMREHLAANPELKRLRYREQPGAGNQPASRPSPAATPTPAALPQWIRAPQPPPRVDDLPGLLEVDLDEAAGRDMAGDVMAEIVGGEYAGLIVEVNGVESYDEFGHAGDLHGILVRAKIYADALDGTEVGNVQRAFYRDDDGQLVAVHAFLQLGREQRGKGFASEFNAHLEGWYRSQGITRIEVHANIDIGGYTWASHGYDFADEESADEILHRLRREIRSTTDKTQIEQAEAILERAEYEAFGSDDYPSAWEISQCGRSADDADWIGKRAMLGSDWEGVKWL